tara:strand:+ start:599 stop:1162 length:564 start_codon:yes stop_codon:yes gene_type:complete
MYKLFTDKPETFECDIKIEGASLSNSKARLVVETKDYSLMFNGKINSTGKCSIPIKKLKGLIDESSKGDIRLEVIAEDTYFTPWESKFEIEASKKVTVEVKSQTSNKDILKEKVQVKNIKQEVTQKETDHVVNIMKLLVRENISINNLSIKKDRLNKVIATYCKHMPITENKKSEVIHGVLKELHKK